MRIINIQQSKSHSQLQVRVVRNSTVCELENGFDRLPNSLTEDYGRADNRIGKLTDVVRRVHQCAHARQKNEGSTVGSRR
jgi:hypothetical protein